MGRQADEAGAKKRRGGVKDGLGYVDVWIGTREHDACLLWLEENIATAVGRVFGAGAAWDEDVVARNRLRASKSMEKVKAEILSCADASPQLVKQVKKWRGLGDAPRRSVHYGQVVVQAAIRSGMPYQKLICYADVATTVQVDDYLGLNNESVRAQDLIRDDKDGSEAALPSWYPSKGVDVTAYFFVEPEIEGYGELVQRIKAYGQHTFDSKFVVVSPDDRFAGSLERQGIGYVKCPTPELLGVSR